MNPANPTARQHRQHRQPHQPINPINIANTTNTANTANTANAAPLPGGVDGLLPWLDRRPEPRQRRGGGPPTSIWRGLLLLCFGPTLCVDGREHVARLPGEGGRGSDEEPAGTCTGKGNRERGSRVIGSRSESQSEWGVRRVGDVLTKRAPIASVPALLDSSTLSSPYELIHVTRAHPLTSNL